MNLLLLFGLVTTSFCLELKNVPVRFDSFQVYRVTPRTLEQLEILKNWMDFLAEKYSNVVTSMVGGRAYEGREIRGVKISFGPGRKGVFIEGGIHVREWIGPATVTYILNELVNSDNATVRAIAESQCGGRRDNRMEFVSELIQTVIGGADGDECSLNFAGSAPFSEIEIKSLSEFIDGIADTLDVFLTFHSYQQLLLIPFGHTGLEVPENNEELHRIGKAAADSLRVRYGTIYDVDNIPNTWFNLTSGTSIDWALGRHRNIRIVYAYELRDTGRYGFLLPPDQIIPTGEETLDSLVRMIDEADGS
ncbi:hypothetical protein ILUMI_24251 [Ignelater luminosus]|uniref:Peptidase M14 domain-containing protein n=1 Tax=Ignelater luminosus TaxID=2038154 RepID=A0A8K0CAV2_IGNLU|nr:hypothetical protein ILUMI_24251 [Ignelater luminosus]